MKKSEEEEDLEFFKGIFWGMIFSLIIWVVIILAIIEVIS